MTIEERLQRVKERSEAINSLQLALEFLDSFQTLYNDVMNEYVPEDKIYHLAKMLLYNAICWVVTEYDVQGESERYYEAMKVESWGAGLIANEKTGKMTTNK